MEQQPRQMAQQPPISTTDQTAMTQKCARFFRTLLHLSQQPDQNQGKTSAMVKELVREVIFGTMLPEVFTIRLQEALRSQAQPHLLPFLRKTLPALRQALRNGEIIIDDISPPPASSGSQLTHAVQISPQTIMIVNGGISQTLSPVFWQPANPLTHHHVVRETEASLQSHHDMISKTTRKRSISNANLLSPECGTTRNYKEPALKSISRQPPADAVLLDDLVIERSITFLHFIDRIFHERVNRRFARMLRYSYRKMKISLTVTAAYAIRGPVQRSPLANKREVIFAKEHEICLALRLIFKRFNRFRCLELCATNVDFVMGALLETLSRYHFGLTYLRRLQLDFDDKVLGRNSCQVIDTLSNLLKVLVINGSWMTDENSGKHFWSAVAKCRNLRKFSYNPECDVYGANDFVQNCVKKLNQLTSFSTGKNIEFGNSYWLAQCLSGAEKLSNLSIASCYRSQIFTLSAPTLKPLISKLKTIGLHFDKEHLPSDSVVDILKITHALPGDGSLSVCQSLRDLEINHLLDNWANHLMSAVAQELYFWLSLSDETNRSVFLLLHFNEKTFIFANRLLKRLAEWPAISTVCFDGVAVTPLKNAMRVRLKDGRVKLAIRKVADSNKRNLM